jgi:hypothetical protein
VRNWSVSGIGIPFFSNLLDSHVSILEVLRKALVVARKLSLTDAQVWIEKELNGYKGGDKPPEYRLLTGQVRAWNPYHGWIPVIFGDSHEAIMLSKCFVGQPVGELEDLLKHGQGVLQFPFDPETERSLMAGQDLPLQPTRHLSRSCVAGILDAVRNMILDWCLKLEKDGIVGEGLVFSVKEKAVAAAANYTINYNAPVTNSQIQQDSPHATQAMHFSEVDRKALADFVNLLKDHASELQLKETDRDRMDTEARKLETEIASSAPRAPLVQETLQTIRSVLEKCAGSLLASGLLFEIGKLVK